ncbi:MAG: hypothetical protein A2Z32_09315 [Chloroflexi bacterium RBG_16_69_14]|nr:MAG: hypothetical protein A2Z32_09315 [Chloroflexi bacterium RBG_16_69_14]
MNVTDDRTSGLLALFGATHRAAVRAEWSAAQAAGLDLRVVDDGQLLLGATPAFPSTMFNRGLGFTEQPGRIAEAVTFFAEHGVDGEIVLDPADLPPGIEPRIRLDAYLGAAEDILPAPVAGLALRIIDHDEVDVWAAVIVEAYAPIPEVAAVWRSAAPHLAAAPERILVVGDLDGRLVAASSSYLADGIGWLSWAAVLPQARGRGIQRAMIAERARLTAERGCERVAAWAFAGTHSSANLARAGMPRIGERVVVRSSDLR